MTGDQLAEPRKRQLSRRQAIFVVAGASALGAGGGAYYYRRTHRTIPLYSETVAFNDGGERVLVTPSHLSEVAPGTRHFQSAAMSKAASGESAFLRDAAAWLARVPEKFQPLARAALSDLWVLSYGLPATVAGWSDKWRYVWPRDAAFAAVALSAVGSPTLAVSNLKYLNTVQSSDGWFEARYDLRTGKAPDARRRQFDGTGLVLWALHEVQRRSGRAATADLGPLATRCHTALMRATKDGMELPPASPDYWETKENQPTVSLAACVLGGLKAGAQITGRAQDSAAAESFKRVVAREFSGAGYQRYRKEGGADSGIGFFAATGSTEVISLAKMRATRSELTQPAGGLNPGSDWYNDGMSWTPSTSLVALAMAKLRDRDSTDSLLTWLDQHRTRGGSLPEKVQFDGKPAAVAPLSWTAANVILALDSLYVDP